MRSNEDEELKIFQHFLFFLLHFFFFRVFFLFSRGESRANIRIRENKRKKTFGRDSGNICLSPRPCLLCSSWPWAKEKAKAEMQKRKKEKKKKKKRTLTTQAWTPVFVLCDRSWPLLASSSVYALWPLPFIAPTYPLLAPSAIYGYGPCLF